MGGGGAMGAPAPPKLKTRGLSPPKVRESTVV